MPYLNSPLLPQPITLPSLSCMEQWLEFEDYLWVLRQLCGIVLSLHHAPNAARQFKQRLRRFEKTCLLPHYLSTLPLEKVLRELEDAQYLYPLTSRTITVEHILSPQRRK